MLLMIFGLLTITNVQSQSLRLKKADKYFREFSYDKAIKAYESIDDKNAGIYRNLAKSYLMLGNTGKAEENYSKLMSTGKYKPSDVYDYASVLLMNKKYDEAANWMQKYYKLNPKDSRAQAFMKNPLYYRDLLKSDLNVKLENQPINTEYEDFSPVYYRGNQVVFASSRGDSKFFNRKWNGNRQPFLDLYKADLTDGNTLTNVTKFDENVNKKYHDAPATFNKDGDYMVVTRNVYDEEKLPDNKLMLYESELQYDQYWSEPEPLSFNSKEYSCGQASLTPDGNTMYFASDMPGGFGGTDIYKVERRGDGSWGNPVNLGKDINTEGNEMFPYFDEQGGYLFYSSNGLPGLGGLDIFVSKVRKGGGYTTPLNLGSPINTNRDDFSFIYREDGSGFLSSNREGGKGDDDIYGFRNLKGFQDKIEDCSISGTIKDKKTEEPLDFARVVLYDANNKKIGEAETDVDGKYAFPIDCGDAYKLRVSRYGYQPGSADIDTKEFDTPDIVKDFALYQPDEAYAGGGQGSGKGLCSHKISPLYYDLDKYYIRYNDKVKLDEIIKLMNEYPEMVLEVASHTDSRASKAYNVTLSKNRTNSVVQYLVDHGINRDRIVAKWFGEIYPVNGCVDGVPCSEEEHQQNRRTEFRILNCV
ncbi:MAG: OmpA family protein, partial [Gammaproteobacteria bacterium]|nr:OmpA family protein [Gammaproteobacteria bacterium]